MVAVVSPSPSSTRRPALRVIEGGRSPRLVAATYRRRRLTAAVLGLVAVVVVAASAVAGLRAAGSALAPSPAPAAASGAPGAAPPDAYVVQPGDTLWSIAASPEGGGDIRAVVDRLAAETGGAGLQPGDRVDLRAAGGA